MTHMERLERLGPGYGELLGEPDVACFADLRQRGEQVSELLPRVWEVAEATMAANAGIED